MGLHPDSQHRLLNVSLSFSQFTQPDWVTVATTMNKAQFSGFKFELKDPNGTGTTGSVSIRSIAFSGWTPPIVGLFEHNTPSTKIGRMNFRNGQLSFAADGVGPWSLSLHRLDGSLLATMSSGSSGSSFRNQASMPAELPPGSYFAVLQQGGRQESLMLPWMGLPH